MNHNVHAHSRMFSVIRERKTPSKNDKYHTFVLTIYYEVDKPKMGKKNIKEMGKKEKTHTRMFG